MIEDIEDQLANNTTQSNTYIETLGICNVDIENIPERLEILKLELAEEENSNNLVIKETTLKIKEIYKKIEKLYKDRKPSNIKIPANITKSPDTYLLELKEKNAEIIIGHDKNIKKLEVQITNLHNIEKQIEINNDLILSLEKQMIKLPDSIEELACDNELLKDEYNTNLQNWINNIMKSAQSIQKQDIQLDYANKYYIKFEKSSRDYFLSDEINKYKSTSNEDELIEKQNEIEIETNKLKIEVIFILIIIMMNIMILITTIVV
jgi:hypothetical protein